MGTISYWMSEASGFPPHDLEDALRLTELQLEHQDGEWEVVVGGFPMEWHHTQDDADRKAEQWSSFRPSHVEHVPGGTWLVLTGDQFVFSSPSREEAEGFIFGVIAGSHFAHERSVPDWLGPPQP